MCIDSDQCTDVIMGAYWPVIRGHRLPRAPENHGNSRDEPFPRPADLLQEAGRHLLRRARHRHQRAARLGGRLSQALAARQNRPLDPRGELHRVMLLENLRQGRHRHLGDAADRLSADAARSPEPRARGLRGRLLKLWREARTVRTPVGAWASIVEDADKRASYTSKRGKPGRAEFIPVALRQSDSCLWPERSGPDGSGRLSPLRTSTGFAFLPAADGDVRRGRELAVIPFTQTGIAPEPRFHHG